MFGMGMGEIVLIAIVALLVVGPDRLPGAAKSIGKGIRDLRKQTKDLQNTIENDTQIGEAVREIKGALRGDPESLYKRATGEDFNPKKPVATAKADASKDGETGDESAGDDSSDDDSNESGETTAAADTGAADSTDEAEAQREHEEAQAKAQAFVEENYGNSDDGWGAAPVNPHVDLDDPDLPKIRTPSGALSRGDLSDDDAENA